MGMLKKIVAILVVFNIFTTIWLYQTNKLSTNYMNQTIQIHNQQSKTITDLCIKSSIQNNIIQEQKTKLQSFIDKVCKVLPEGAWLEEREDDMVENHTTSVESILDNIIQEQKASVESILEGINENN